MESARKSFGARDDIIDLFEKGIFLYNNVFKTKKEESEEESEENKLEKIKDYYYTKFFKYIEDESMGNNYNLFKYYFYFSVPCALAKKII